MKKIKFIKTIRFRLTMWYLAFFILLILAFAVSVNLVMLKYHANFPPRGIDAPGDIQTVIQTLDENNVDIMNDLRRFTTIGTGLAILIGALGVYYLSGRMLKPIDKVTTLAESISYTNLKERLNYAESNDEIKHLADTFDGMLARLEKATESQKQFIQDASHELRTPIATALTNIEVLELNSEATREDYQHLLTVLKNSLDRMNHISNGLLLLSGDNHSPAKLSKVELGGVITEIINEVDRDAQKQGIRVNWDRPARKTYIMGDLTRIRQVIFNLADNAIKYNRPGGSVSITQLAKNNSAVIKITDTGIGIGQDDLPHIFDRFFRVDKSRSRQKGGSGLGLAIVKKIVEEHQGTVEVHSALGEGSTFYVNLPLASSK
jgi:signal transduction histidine kinase